MSVDLSRVASAASAAALDDGKPRRRGLTGMGAVVLGAALGTAARLAVARAPVPDFARLPDLVCERLADRGLLPEDEEDFDEGGEVEPEAKTSDEEPAAEAEPQAEHRADRTVAPVQLRVARRRGGAGMTTTIAQQEVALIDLVDRLLGGGVVIAGDITLAVADVGLVYVQLRALVSAVATAQEKGVLPRMGSAL